jgi:hypothetical protein
MQSARWFRFTLNQLMAVIAFFAVLMAAAISERHITAPGSLSTFADPKYWLTTAVRFAGAGVCLYNLRLSWWMWLVLAGYIGPWLVGIATGLTIVVWNSAPNASFPVSVARVSWAANLVLQLVFVVGLAAAFRDIRRRIPDLEGPQE